MIDRYHYKQDVQGYLLSGRHSYIYLYDVATQKLERLTKGKWDEAVPSWSPDGTRIAFLSNHSADPDREPSSQVYVAEAAPGAVEKQLTQGSGRAGRSRLEWSPDGKILAFLESDEKKWGAYNMDHLALVAADASAAPRRLKAVEALDRGVSSPRFMADGKSVEFLVTDDQSVYPARASVDGSSVERLMATPVVLQSISKLGGCQVAITGGNAKANEVYALDGGSVRQLSHQNDTLFAELELGATEEEVQEQGRHRGPRTPHHAARLHEGRPRPDAPPHPRRTQWPGRP